MANASDKPVKKAKKTSPAEFFRQVTTEVKKVTWPTWGELRVTTIMVFIMVSLAAMFFYFVDILINMGIQFILGLGA